MSDAGIKQDVLDELEFEPSVDATAIGVAVTDGVVTLTGHVETYPQKLALERAALRIRGVKGIALEIEVRPRPIDGVDDEQLARQAIDALHWSTLVPDGKLVVEVEHGRVTLRGTLDWSYQKLGAIETIRHLRGVTDVIDLIELHDRLAAGDVRAAIEGALKRNAEIGSEPVEVAVYGNRVALAGQVRTWRARQVAERAAWSVPGVTEVSNHLLVG